MGLKHHHGTSSNVARGYLLREAQSEIILRKNFVDVSPGGGLPFSARFLHNSFAHGVWPGAR
jgi:hypothetical protein